MNKISIIIPILNEAETIGVLLQHLTFNSSEKNIAEIIVVDGGSSDNSAEIVSKFSNVKLLKSLKGRAKQMNIGAKDASGEILYFLHADSFPPKHFDQLIIKEVTKGNNTGCFRMKFDSSHPILKISQWFTRFNFIICRGGDQSLFITKAVFNSLNGYNENFDVYEDCELINRIYGHYSFTIIDDYVITSARRYAQNSIWKLQYHFAIIHLKKWLGASAEELHRYYKKNIA